MQPSRPAVNQGDRLLLTLLFQGKPVFTIPDALAAATQEKIPHNQLKKLLYALTNQRQVLQLRRGLYVSIGLLPKQTDTHPFAISAYLVWPSAISHWSALQYHGLTEQVPQIITASTAQKIMTPAMRKKESSQAKLKHALKINAVCYEYIPIQQKNFFGLEKIWIDEDIRIMITDKERTLLDLFIYPKIFGGMGEACGILENALPTINIKKLVDYAIQYNKKSIIKRLGWVLEQFGVSVSQLEPLLNIPMHYYARLDPSAPAGSCDKRWMIQNNLNRMKDES